MTTSQQTRRAAWDAIQPKAGTDRNIVLRVLENYQDMGLADFELFMALPGWALASIVARRNELVKLGLVEDAGRVRRNTRTHRYATVWVAVKPVGQGELF